MRSACITYEGPHTRSRALASELLNEVGEREHLAAVNEVELLDKEEEVLEDGIEVRLLLQLLYPLKVVYVDEGKDAEEALEDGA